MITLIRRNGYLLPVFSRFGIKLGFRDKTVGEICDDKDIDANFFLAIINTFHNSEYFPENKLLSFPPQLIVHYLKETHQYYIRFVLPKIEGLLNRLIEGNTQDLAELKLINAFYKKYKNELLFHINNEEEFVFPYVLNLLNRGHQSGTNFTIHSFEKEHANIDIKLNDLKNLIIKYIEPVYDEHICNEFLITLFRFEKDLQDHARIEDKILIPQIIKIEKDLAR
jgi:regulator of cell morphogenesis and NO signaling